MKTIKNYRVIKMKKSKCCNEKLIEEEYIRTGIGRNKYGTFYYCSKCGLIYKFGL